jgi:hypothetical protein
MHRPDVAVSHRVVATDRGTAVEEFGTSTDRRSIRAPANLAAGINRSAGSTAATRRTQTRHRQQKRLTSSNEDLHGNSSMAFAGDSSGYLTYVALPSRSLQQTREQERASLVETKSATAS